MKIFKDKELTQEVGEFFDFEIVSAGDSKEITYYILNDKSVTLENLIFSFEHEEVEIIKAPKELAPHSIGELIIKWDASMDLEEGLRVAFNITGKRLYT